MALINKLNAIGDAIREKTGSTEKLTLDQMPLEIASITTGGAEVEPIVLSGECEYTCTGKMGSEFIKLYGDKISTDNMTGARYMFYFSELERIPFELNFNQTTKANMAEMFSNCHQLVEVPNINNAYPSGISKMFSTCYLLRYLPEDLGETWNWDQVHSDKYAGCSEVFQSCHSLRKVPQNFLSNLWGAQTTNTYLPYKSTFYYCFALDGVSNIPIHRATMTSNMFSSTIGSCYRIKSFTFATNEDGTPETANWKSQTLDFSSNIGHVGAYNGTPVLNYNSGITADKEVKDDATYQALKNDPDWFTTKMEYSRYNHDSAVETINSLPDTSAYLATAGGTNTIKFKGAAGSKTDGGAINTLTEEEIAVAAAKGWTVTFA